MALAALVAPMILVKHDRIYGLLGDLPLATRERGTHEPLDHFDQRGSPDNGVELVDSQRFEGGKRVAKEPFGARQPAVSFSLMVALLLRLRLVEDVIMVPGRHEEISGSMWHHGTECRIHRFGVCARDYYIIKMRTNGLERCAHGSAVECVDPVEQEQQCRAHRCVGA